MFNLKLKNQIKIKDCLFHCLFFTFFPPADFANKLGSIWSLSSPLTEKSLCARCSRVPPHLRPRSMSACFSLSNPQDSRSAAQVAHSKLISGCVSWLGRTDTSSCKKLTLQWKLHARYKRLW